MPTAREAGFVDAEAVLWQGVCGPPNIPKPALARLTEEIRRGLARGNFFGRALEDQVLRLVAAAAFVAIAVKADRRRIGRQIEVFIIRIRHRARHMRFEAVFFVDVRAFADAPVAVAPFIEIERDAPGREVEFVAVHGAALIQRQVILIDGAVTVDFHLRVVDHVALRVLRMMAFHHFARLLGEFARGAVEPRSGDARVRMKTAHQRGPVARIAAAQQGVRNLGDFEFFNGGLDAVGVAHGVP